MTKRNLVYQHLNPDAREGRSSPVSYALLGLILFSVFIFAIETESAVMRHYGAGVNMINFIIAIIFGIEYVFRVWSCVEDKRFSGRFGRLKFIFTPMAVIDLVAFLPALILVSGSNTYWLRILRVIRLLSLLKLGRYGDSLRIILDTIREGWRELVVALCGTFFFLFLSAVLLYFVEGDVQPEAFGSIPRTLWWSVATLTTVGYGDVYPVTPAGKFCASVIALLGIAIVALPAGILASRFREQHLKRAKRKSSLS